MTTYLRAGTSAVLYIAFGCLWMGASDYLTRVVIADGPTLLRVRLITGIGFVVYTAALLYFLLRLRDKADGRDKSTSPPPPSGCGRYYFPLLFLVLALTAPLLGYGVYRMHRPEMEREAFANLSAIARLRVEGIENWLAERQGDSAILAASQGFTAAIAQFAKPERDPAAHKLILERLEAMRAAYTQAYDSILILDVDCHLLISVGDRATVSGELQDAVRKALKTGEIQRNEVYRDRAGEIHFDWVVPMIMSNADGERAIAATVLRASPKHFLIPLLQTWTATGSHAESLLVRKDGDSLLYLHSQPHEGLSPLTLRLPLTVSDLPAGVAIRAAGPGVMQGTDYRGKAVLAAYHPVHGTHWHLITKVDRDEVLAPLGSLVAWVSLLVFLTVAFVGATLLMLWRQRQRAHQWELMAQTAAAIAESEARLRAIVDNAPAVIFMKDTAGRYLLVNRSFETLLDVTDTEIQGNTDYEIFPAGLAEIFAKNDQLVVQHGQAIEVEELAPHHDGLHAYLSVKFPLRKNSGEIYAVCGIASDITERKLAEAKIQRLTQFYAALSQCNQAIVRCTTEAQLFPQVCRHAVKFGGLSMAWIGLVDADTQRVQPVASFGKGTQYLDNIEISVDRESPFGQGPTGTAIREGYPIWCQNFLSNPSTSAWHARAENYGWNSSAALPIRRNGVAIGAFTLYASESNAFDATIRDLLVKMATDISFALDKFSLAQEHERAEQRLRDSEAFNLSVLDSLLANIAVLDAHGVILSVNRSWQRFAQRNHAAGQCGNWIGLNYLEFCRDADDIKSGIQAVLAGTAGTFGAEYPCHAPNEQRWFYMHVSPLQGSTKGVVIAHENITQRKLAEQSLRKSEALFHTLAMTVPVGLFRTDAAGNCVFVNERWCNLVGISREEALGRSWIRSLAEEDRTGVTAAWEASIREWRAYHQEFRLLRPDGTIAWVIGQAEAEKDDAGRILGYVGTITDITTLKLSEERLRQAAVVFENAQEGVMVTDANERIVMVNRAFSELTGYAAEEVMGKTPRIIKSGRHARGFFETLWQSVSSSGQWQGEIWNRRKDGEVYPVLLSISSVMDDSGKVAQYVGVFADISQIKDATEKLDYLAHHDPLTGLPNRLLLCDRLKHSLGLSVRERKNLALLMLDLDRFKDVNDSFGHLAGDELLQQVANRLSSRLRGIDTVTRLGGDEFAVLLEDISHPQDAGQVASEIINALTEPWRLSNGVEVRIGASVGISLFPEHGETSEELLQHADAALYRAKDEGRGSFKYFSDDITQAARRRINLESMLRRAILREELEVHYQPQIEVASGRIVGVEALLRWQDPVQGPIPPSRFIPVAEETGLIASLGEWVLGEACRQGRAWLDAGLQPLNLAVNLSPHQFRHGDIHATVAAVLDETGFPAKCLELELTESALMERESVVVGLLQSLRALGVRLAIDDFGTGYSSLAYLKRFPLDILKIDKSFIEDIPHHQDDMEIAAAIIAMSHTLRLKVLAEGVETQEQFEFLKTQSCDLYQGYLHSKPMPAEEFLVRYRQDLLAPFSAVAANPLTTN